MRPEHRQEAELDRDEHDEQQAPPEDRHRIAEQRHGHQRLVEHAAALDGGDRAGRHADENREHHGEERQLQRRRKQRQELGQHLLLRRQRHAEVAVQELPHIVEELPPQRLVEPELVAEVGEPFGRNPMLADPDLDGVAGDEADRDEGEKHQRQKRRDRQRDAAEKVSEHGRSEDAPAPPLRAEPEPALLDVDAFERMRAERALLVARRRWTRIASKTIECASEQLGRLVMLDFLHPLIELGALGLIGDRRAP